MEKQEKAFKELKKRFTEEPVLVTPDLDKKNKNGDRCIRLCNGGSIIDGMWGWVVETSSIPF